MDSSVLVRKSKVAIAMLLVVLLLDGCAMNQQEHQWIIGSSLFLTYLIAIAVTFLTSAITNWELFSALITKTTPALLYLSSVIQLVGVAGFLIGVLTPAESWSHHLIALAGAMLVAEGQFLRMYLKSPCDKADKYLKALSVTTVFLIAMFAIASGVEI